MLPSAIQTSAAGGAAVHSSGQGRHSAGGSNATGGAAAQHGSNFGGKEGSQSSIPGAAGAAGKGGTGADGMGGVGGADGVGGAGGADGMGGAGGADGVAGATGAAGAAGGELRVLHLNGDGGVDPVQLIKVVNEGAADLVQLRMLVEALHNKQQQLMVGVALHVGATRIRLPLGLLLPQSI